ncbi:lytic transglycosylase domain-containing protein [Methylocystis sp. H4A]|uniref:lytic transglycosylase domain-containing protein n=1 Tax=Methylocystis sp. H4A TaxID=2785788 RepID=UPI0018C276D4|nr:lytic transglycosylase domain-containing protein [Methylocystis sp. H4A]MBG0802154.1 lytic transglycosylase domain-containing protein [Methylocystis sp. H4A]
MMLPRRVATRFKLTVGIAALVIAAPAFTGLDRLGDGEAKRKASWRWTPSIPFSLGAWRSRVGTLQETVREFVDRKHADDEAAHPLESSLFAADEGALPPIVAYVPAQGWLNGAAAKASLAALLGDDTDGFIQAVALYKGGDFAQGDEAASRLRTPLADAARWTGLRLHPREAGFKRIAEFLAAHPDWPAGDWLRRRAEQALVAERHADKSVLAWFADNKPLTGFGKYAQARAIAREGDFESAAALARDAWRNDDIGQGFDTIFNKELGEFLTPADHKFRADRLLYAGKNTLALRSAEFAGKDVALLARARMSGVDKLAAALPASVQNDPGLLYGRVHKLRNDKKFAEAGALLRNAPRDIEKVVDGDAWWEERRIVARKLLDQGDPQTAYTLCADHAAAKTSNKVDAEFNAGWIALRFLNDPIKAERHFTRLAQVAETPLQKSRAYYWLGRAAETAHAEDDSKARNFYLQAATHSTTFYGQLANSRVGADERPLRRPPTAASGDSRAEAVRVAELLFAVGEKDVAAPLALDSAKYLQDEAQVAALGEVIARQGDAKLSLIYGKAASYRGIALDDVAFPAYGVPDFNALPGSASRSMVFAVARQESAFDPKAVSSAGAMGLMQMIASTARHTAYMRGVSFDMSRMLSDPPFNAQLGAAHLGILLGEYRGAYLLTFAAYNAGGGRVKQWIDAYGDPRKPNVDPIDWVERIPITETRNYVQRVMENFVVYRAKFEDTGTRSPQVELARVGDSL